MEWFRFGADSAFAPREELFALVLEGDGARA
jgi:hypothetical protein